MTTFKQSSRKGLLAIAMAITLMMAFPQPSHANPLSCDALVCELTLSANLTLQAQTSGVQETQLGRYEISGDVTLMATDMNLPLGNTQLVLSISPIDGTLLEFYGLAQLPLDQWSILKDAQLEGEPPLAAIGLFQLSTVNELFHDLIPINDGVSMEGTVRQSTQPYLVFHASTGGLSMNINQMLNLGMSENSSLALTVPGQTSISFVLDVIDPYVFVGRDYSMSFQANGKIEPETRYLAITTRTTNELGEVLTETTEYYDDQDRLVARFITDKQTGSLVKQDIDSNGNTTVSFYQRDAEGDYVREGLDKSSGDYFNLLEVDNGVDVNNANRTRLSGFRTVTYDEKNAEGEVLREVIEYRDPQDKLVSKFFRDPRTDTIIKHQFDDDDSLNVSVYQLDASGDYVNIDGDKNTGDYFTLAEIQNGVDVRDTQRNRDRDLPPVNDTDGKKRIKFEIGVDGMAFSANGWMPFVTQNTYGVPTDAQTFSGQLYLKGAVNMNGFTVLDGEVVAYAGQQGFSMGGNGDLAFTLPGLPSLVDFSLYLGSASSTVQITPDKQLSFISGVMAPDTALFQKLLPIAPQGEVLAAGYVGNDLQNTQITLEGNFSIGAQLLGDLIGVELQDLQSVSGSARLSPTGFSLHGITTNQIHPNIQFGTLVSVDVDISFVDPNDFRLRLSGAADVYGVGLDEVSIEINRNGMFLNGVFVTPLTEIAMLGSVTQYGPSLSGYATISLGLGDITQAMQDATATLKAAQAEVQRLTILIDQARSEVLARRAQHQQELQAAEAAVAAAQSQVNSINTAIAKEYSGISYQKAKIAAKYRWYKQAKWYQKASRYSAYIAEKTWRNAVIAKHYAAIGVLKASLAAATLVLDGAKLTLQGLQALTEVTPVDLDPQVASLIVARETANLALDIAMLPFENVPVIDHDFAGKITATLDFEGLRGTVSAEFDGYSALTGTATFLPIPNACVDIPSFGQACTQF